ncbi:hypothetical protein F5144DRAFT_172183 [Chaetomium tenue]|uniref:Uncharacterized protein n=1 Tax=Chaetomium tenue TaxID=1854479 RepID=A0ACB7PAN1_9PEZI|nr:hypothetical protein F5144DRAFT_172183 [Chaetomium globosum]
MTRDGKQQKRSENRPFLSPQCDPANGETRPTVHHPLGISVGYADAGTDAAPHRADCHLVRADPTAQPSRNSEFHSLLRSARGSLCGSCKKVERQLGRDIETPRLYATKTGDPDSQIGRQPSNRGGIQRVPRFRQRRRSSSSDSAAHVSPLIRQFTPLPLPRKKSSSEPPALPSGVQCEGGNFATLGRSVSGGHTDPKPPMMASIGFFPAEFFFSVGGLTCRHAPSSPPTIHFPPCSCRRARSLSLSAADDTMMLSLAAYQPASLRHFFRFLSRSACSARSRSGRRRNLPGCGPNHDSSWSL